jgi:uncharacterized protein (TIGR04255 family)
MARQVYPRPPIVEAMIEFRFAVAVPREFLFETLRSSLATRYPAEARQDRLDVSIKTDGGEPSAVRAPHLAFLRSNDGLRALGCGEQTLSVHVLAPYPGWESFIEQVEEALGALPEEASAGGLTAVGVRYIDTITLPGAAKSIGDYLTIMPQRPEGLPSALSAFHFATQTVDEEDGTVARLTLAAGPPTPEGAPVVIYDLSLRREGAALCGLRDAGWRPIVEALHQRQRDVFEASITDRMREMFQ